jgi:hypothetical protein
MKTLFVLMKCALGKAEEVGNAIVDLGIEGVEVYSITHLYEGRAGKEADPGGKPKQEKESAPQKEIPLRRAICAEARVTTIGTH